MAGFLAAIPGLITAGKSIYDMFKKPKQEEAAGGEIIQKQPLLTKFQGMGGEALSQFVGDYMAKFAPGETYPGKLTAGATPQEQASLDILTKFMGEKGIGDLFGAGQKQIMETLGGKYMPGVTPYTELAQSPFVEAMKTVSGSNLEDIVNQIRAKRGARGTFFTKEGIREEAQAGRGVAENLDLIISQWMAEERERERGYGEKERGRMFQAAPIAATLDEYLQQTIPMAKMQAGQTLGALARTIEQGELERRYQDFIRQREEMQLPLGAAKTLYAQGGTQWDIPGVQMPYQEEGGATTIDKIMQIAQAAPAVGKSIKEIWDIFKKKKA